MRLIPTLLAAIVAFSPAAVRSQEERPAEGRDRPVREQAARPAPERREGIQLPPPVSVPGSVDLGDSRIAYRVTAGSIDIRDGEGRLTAEVAFTAYVRDGQDAASRPVTFAFNGGPGASSAYLHLAAIGPKRLATGNEGDTPSKPPVLQDNRETWLGLTDLVFIDPPGTGYSRAVGSGDAGRQHFSVDGDIAVLSRVVQRWLAENGRLTSPTYLAGESYGGFRVPRIAARLQTGEGVGVSGLMLLSPVVDFGTRTRGGDNPVALAARLPSFVAVARERDGAAARESVADAEAYATGEYLTDLVRGDADPETVRRRVARVAALTGLPESFVARSGGRIETGPYLRELFRDRGRVGSAYDGSVTTPDPYPTSLRTSYEDPILDGMTAPLTSAAIAYTRDVLGWKPEGRYELLSREVNRRWNWGGGLNPPDAVGDLRSVMALDPSVRVVVAHGLTDLVTTYLETKVALDRIPASLSGDRLKFAVYPGGHMFYSRDGSRRALRADIDWLYRQR